MAKNKVRQEVVNNDYFYEVFGITLVILSIVTLGELGSFGSLIFLLLRLFIGDFAFLLVIFMLFLGLKCLIKKELIDFKTISFQGIILILLGLTLVSHFAIFNAFEISNSQVLSKTLELFRYYFSSFQSHYVTGGGLIGALLFQGIILLLGEVGVLLISLSFFILGLSFIFNSHLISLFTSGKRFRPIITKVFFGFITYFKNLNYKQKPQKKNYNININIGLLRDVATSNNKTLQEQINKEVEENLIEYIKNNNMFCIYHGFKSSYVYTRYILEVINESSYKLLREKMNIFFSNKCFFIRSNENIVYVEVYNIFKELLTLKTLLLKTDEKGIYLGLDIENEIVRFNEYENTCLIMTGDYNGGIKNSIKSMIVNILMVNQRNVNFLILDNRKDFLELSNVTDLINYSMNSEDSIHYFDKILTEYEKRKDILNYLNVDNYLDANEQIKTSYPNIDQIKPIYVIVNSDLTKTPMDFDNKLDYLIKFSYKTGIFFIVVARKKEELSKLKVSYNIYMSFYTSDLDYSLKLCGNENLCCLNKKGDFVYINKNEARHCQAPYISNADYMNILKRII